jgi:PAS domain S-box-containing protein
MAFFARSIRHRLVLLILATVLVVVAVHDIAALVELRRTALMLATERLDGVSARLSEMLQQQGRVVRQTMNARAHDQAVVSFLQGRTPGVTRDSAAAAAALERATGPMVAGAALWAPDGRVVLSAGRPLSTDPAYARTLIASASGKDSIAIGAIHRDGDSLAYAVIARVGTAPDVRGYMVEWRRVGSNAGTRRQLLALIGPDAAIYVGNATDSVWTDFAGIAPPPPAPLAATGLTSYTRLGDGPRLAAARNIDGTPWTLLIELPEGPVFAPVRAMMKRLAIITVVLLALGLAGAWLFGARLTTPLTDLASAAAAISGGEYSRRVAAAGPDEVGTLGRAFNQMAGSIEAAHRVLQERSDELAYRAEQLAEQASELEMSNEELAESVEETIRTRDELAAVSAELDASLGSAPVGFALHDADGRYRRVNASLATLHGVAADQHVGRMPSEVIPEIGVQLERHLEAALAGDARVVNVELTGRTPGSPTRTQHWLASVYPIRTSDGERLGVGSVVTDLTAYKQLEQQLLQAQKMEAIGRLAGGVAHDFNNILTAIEGFGQFALADLDADHDASPRRDIEQVLAAAQRAGALTRQLLAFSRQQVLQPRVLDLNAVVTGLSPMLARLIGTDIQLKTIPAPRLSAVKADPGQMEQVLVNLVVNARDAMPNGGSVVIETADVDLDASYVESHEGLAAGSYVMLAVTDSGTGMDAATRAQIFDPFFTTKGRDGTGLGLSTVYGIVKQSGGNVEVYSEVGRGTSFKVYLPRSDERAERHTPTRATPPVPNGQATVLLVDDDPHVSAAARRALERAGYVVLSATNGREGLHVAETHRQQLDLLITDLVMPEMGGRELARRLAQVRPDVRVLYTSGYTAEAVNQQAVLELGDAFLGKPFSPDGLLRRVHEMLRPGVPT